MSLVHDGRPDFAERILPALRAIPCFRMTTDEEVAASFAAYHAGDVPGVIDAWARVAEPTRATLRGAGLAVYRNTRRLPRALRRISFLATLRAVLAAGRRCFEVQLRPETARAIRGGFSWLERRHEHVPPGWTPPFSFPAPFIDFIEGGDDLDGARARFQLVAAQNEVQQHVYSRHLAELFDLPELAQHAERERAMALEYFARWSPPCTEALWRQCLLTLDGLNAAVFAIAFDDGHTRSRWAFAAGALRHVGEANAEWARFVDGMREPAGAARAHESGRRRA